MSDVLILAAHPDLHHSRVHRAIFEGLRAAERRGDGGVRWAVRDLYALYPDFLIDAEAEQAALQAARLVVWLHPIHWYGMPPLMKLWLDDVLTFGWAYGLGGHALVGKDLWTVVSTGGTESSYRPDGHNRYFIDAFWPPYEQTASLCGMRFLPPAVLHGAHRAGQPAIDDHVATVIDRLGSWPDWPEIEDMPACVQCEAPSGERPDASTSGGRT